MPCPTYNNVAETWPQYLSLVTCPQLLALRWCFVVFQLTWSKPVLRGFTLMKGREGELLLLLLFEPMQSSGGTSNPQRVGNPFGWGRFPFDRDLPFFIVFCLGYLDLYSGKADLCVCCTYMVLYLIFYDLFFQHYMDQHRILWERKKKSLP